MSEQALTDVAPLFVELAHEVIFCTVSTVDSVGRPRSRIMHPIWEWDGVRLTGWLATGPSAKLRHLTHRPYASCGYVRGGGVAEGFADCRAERDDQARALVWGMFASAAPPLGFDPSRSGHPGWDTPESPGFVVIRLEPYRERTRTVTPSALDIRTWRAPVLDRVDSGGPPGPLA